jgi:hypothetical protein
MRFIVFGIPAFRPGLARFPDGLSSLRRVSDDQERPADDDTVALDASSEPSGAGRHRSGAPSLPPAVSVAVIGVLCGFAVVGLV